MAHCSINDWTDLLCRLGIYCGSCAHPFVTLQHTHKVNTRGKTSHSPVDGANAVTVQKCK